MSELPPSSACTSSMVLEQHLRSRLRRWLDDQSVETVTMSARGVTVEFSDGHQQVYDLTTPASTPTQKA